MLRESTALCLTRRSHHCRHWLHEVQSLRENVSLAWELISFPLSLMLGCVCRGHGTYAVDGKLLASVAGVVERVNKLIYVRPLKSRCAACIRSYTPCMLVMMMMSLLHRQVQWRGWRCCRWKNHRGEYPHTCPTVSLSLLLAH